MTQGPNISLTEFGARHMERSFTWFNDTALARLLDRQQRISEDEHKRWFASLPERKDCAYFAIESTDGTHIGNIWLADIDQRHRKAELRIVVGDTNHTDRGAGSKAIALLRDLAFYQMHLNRVYAYVLAINPRAKRAFEKAGFVVEGTLKDDRTYADGFVDVYLLAAVNKEKRSQATTGQVAAQCGLRG